MTDKTTHRPWGHYTELYEDDTCKVKRIVVNPGGRLSLQSHFRREEHWTFISGVGVIELEDMLSNKREIIEAPCGRKGVQFVIIEKEQKHRVRNDSEDEPLVFIEVQRGDSFAEEDIVRYQDDYGRA